MVLDAEKKLSVKKRVLAALEKIVAVFVENLPYSSFNFLCFEYLKERCALTRLEYQCNCFTTSPYCVLFRKVKWIGCHAIRNVERIGALIRHGYLHLKDAFRQRDW